MSQTGKFSAYAPLINFRTRLSSLGLGKNLILRKMTREEVDEVKRHLSHPLSHPQASPFDLLTAKHLLQLSFSVPKGEAIDTGLPCQHFTTVLRALHLFDSGDVGFANVRLKQMEGDPVFPGVAWIGRPGSFPSFGRVYSLSPKRSEVFLDFWQKILPPLESAFTKTHSPLGLALDRFSYAFERQRPEDRLLDYMIAFETLLLPEKTELRLRFSSRGSLLLGRNDSERKRIALRLRSAYDVRSEIVHGGHLRTKVNLTGKEISLTRFVQAFERDLARALKAFLLLSPRLNREKIIDVVDAGFLSTRDFAFLRRALRPIQSYIFTEK